MKIKSLWKLLTSVAALVAATVWAQPALATNSSGFRPHLSVFRMALTGSEEVPGPGDPDGRGRATIFINDRKNKICFIVHVRGITLPATAAHIHDAPAGAAGPVDVTLTPPNRHGFSFGCVDTDQQQIDDILEEPADYYVNVHNADYPSGALRGQFE